MKLYEITAVMRSLLDTLSEAALSTDEDSAEALAAHAAAQAAFDATTEELESKLRAYIAFALELKVEREARQAQMDIIVSTVLDKMRKQNERDQKKEEWLMAQVEGTILQWHIPMPLKFKEFTLKLQKQPPRCEIADSSAIPPEYIRVIPASQEPDKRAILADLKEGVIIPGVALAPAAFKLVVK